MIDVCRVDSTVNGQLCTDVVRARAWLEKGNLMTSIRALFVGSMWAGALCSLASCLTAAEDDALLSEDTAAIVVPPTLIASGQGEPVGVRVDAATAYWINSHVFAGGPSDIVFARKSGGGSVAVLQDKVPDMGFMELDSARVYWPQGAVEPGVGGIRSKPKAGGAVVDIVRNRRVFALALSGDHIYFASPDNGGQILRVAKTGGSITRLATVGPGLDNTPFISVVGDKVFFTQSTFEVECDGLVRFVPKTGGAVTTIAKDVCQLRGMAADSTAVYWAEFDGEAEVGRIMKQKAPFTGTPVVLDTLTLPPFFLALDLASVFYTAGAATPGVVARVAKSGGARRTLAVDQQFPSSITLDSAHVYWTTLLDGEVKRVPK
jgi:hypothetical protein